MVNAIGSNTYTTDRGTKIVESSNTLDKNAFLSILTAELSNQDPTNASDSTQYVAQMAQFSSLEQMSNMNSSLEFIQASNMLGKTVVLNSIDDNGNNYVGQVKSIIRLSSGLKMDVDIDNNGVKSSGAFSMDDIKEVI